MPADSKIVHIDRGSHCDVPAIAKVLSAALTIPFGIEQAPGKCEAASGAVALRAAGMTVAQVLDRAIELDPRYRWAEDNGVIVVRPVTDGGIISSWVPKFLGSWVSDSWSPGLLVSWSPGLLVS